MYKDLIKDHGLAFRVKVKLSGIPIFPISFHPFSISTPHILPIFTGCEITRKVKLTDFSQKTEVKWDKRQARGD